MVELHFTKENLCSLWKVSLSGGGNPGRMSTHICIFLFKSLNISYFIPQVFTVFIEPIFYYFAIFYIFTIYYITKFINLAW